MTDQAELMPCWWYRVKYMANAKLDLEAELNRVGEQGWELIAINGTQFVFKCPRRPTHDR